MSSILSSIQGEVADRLLADPFFSNIPVLVETPRDLAFELQTGVAATGIYGVVQVPNAVVSAPNAPGPIFDPVEIAVRFRENVPVNVGPHALEVAETALALLHLYRPVTFNEVFCAAPQALVRVEEVGVVCYEIRVRTQAGASFKVPRLDAPVISRVGNEVTLSCEVPGATIFYTLDGSQPAPRSTNAYFYTGPVMVIESTTMRARAWLAGYLASAETRLLLA